MLKMNAFFKLRARQNCHTPSFKGFMAQLVLLVEDSKEIHRMVEQAVAGALIDLVWAQSVGEAADILSTQTPDLVLLDIELPDGNGVEFCSRIQLDHPEIPVFFLTGHDELSEKIMGFSAGADDYITKPFNPLELRARIEAKLKKIEIIKRSSDYYRWREIEIDKAKQEVSILQSGEFSPIELNALEFKILMYFATRPGVVVERDSMLNDIWGEDVHVYSRSVDTHVSKLRKKLGDQSSLIESVHGAGYKFCPTT